MKCMKYLIKCIFVVITAFTISSCSESSLSDVEITNPSIIRAKVYVYQDFDNKKELIVSFKDKNGLSINLKNGFVSVNGDISEYRLPSTDLFVHKAYVSRLSFNDRDFDVKIQINDTDSYSFRINGIQFPGFTNNRAIESIYYRKPANYQVGSYIYTGTPFNNERIYFEYQIIKPEESLVRFPN